MRTDGEIRSVGGVEELLNWYVIAGVGSIIASTVLAGLTYTTSGKLTGLGGRDIAHLLENDHTPEENLRGIVEGYSVWLQYNFKANTRLAPLGTGILVLLIYGVLCLTAGVYRVAIGETGGVTNSLLIAVLAVITWKSGIVRQLRRYWRYRELDPTED